MKKIIGLGILTLGACIALSGCSLFHQHTIVTDEGRAPTCTESGLSSGSHCSDCGEVIRYRETIPAKGHTVEVDEGYPATCTESGFTNGSHCSDCGTILSQRETIPATGHQFGEWISEKGQDYRECSVCTYREVKSTGGSGGGSVDGSYSNFDFFLRACKETESTLRYEGAENNFVVNLHAGTKRCDGYTLYIPARVTKVSFVGDAKGNPYQDFMIVIEERTNDLKVGFKDVRIESARTIFTSETRNINVSMQMEGVCSFLITSRGKDGANGHYADTNYAPGNGENGEDGQHAMLVNGNCEIDCMATSLEIRGGDAGNGGNGGGTGFFNGCAPGSGGDGGRGGNAIFGENPVIITLHGDAEPILQGGKGGTAGKRGTASVGWNDNASKGHDGTPGEDGQTGCDIKQEEEEKTESEGEAGK